MIVDVDSSKLEVERSGRLANRHEDIGGVFKITR